MIEGSDMSILIWLGSGFAFAVGVAVGAWCMRAINNAHKGHDAKAVVLLRERNEIGEKQVSVLSRIAELVAPRPSCRHCGAKLLPNDSGVADGCPCNSPRGVNHGLVPVNVCTCDACDPEQTGSVRR